MDRGRYRLGNWRSIGGVRGPSCRTRLALRQARKRDPSDVLRSATRLRGRYAERYVTQRQLLQCAADGFPIRAERVRARKRAQGRGAGVVVKAVAFAGPRKMEVREIAEPDTGTGQVVVEVAYCGVCGSDLHEYASPAPSLRGAGIFQPVMGHEFTGTILALGQGATCLSVGDPVVVHPGGPCGACYYCKAGATNLCAEQAGTGYRKQGAYAERVEVRAG